MVVLKIYICATVLYLLSMLAPAYNIIIDSSVGAPVYGIESVYGLNSIENGFYQC